MKLSPSLVLFALCACLCFEVPAAEPVRPWQRIELSVEMPGTAANPYAELSSHALEEDRVMLLEGMTGPARGKSLRIHGFWDGGDLWKFRFKLPAAGKWTYVARDQPGGEPVLAGEVLCVQDKDSGDSESRPAYLAGPVGVKADGARAGRYFVRENGTPFLWVGNAWWNWTKKEIAFSSFRKLVEDRAGKGFTVGQLLIPGNAFSPSASLHAGSYDEIDVAHARKVDQLLAEANDRGIAVMVLPWWGKTNLKSQIGAEQMRRWWRYVIHRWSAYDVIWCVAGEYNTGNYGGMGLSFWNALGELVAKEDPYGHMVSIHPTPPTHRGGFEAAQWHTGDVLHGESWLHFNQAQTAHGRWRNEMIPQVIREAYRLVPAKPIVNTNPWWEFIPSAATAYEVRFAAWAAMLSGAAGHTYGGGHDWRAYVPESPEGFPGWPMIPDMDTLDYPGANSMAVLASFFQGIDWWTLEPRADLVHDYPDPFCLARPGEEYLLYARWGGSPKLDLREVPGSARFQVRWINPATGDRAKEAEVHGGTVVYLAAPEDFPGTVEWRDWVVHLERK